MRSTWAVLAALGALAAVLATAAAASAYVPHAPIRIASVADLEEFPGSGTRTRPYVIEGYEIAATGSHGIVISGTQAHVVVRGVRVANGGSAFDGIVLEKVRNVTVEDSFLEGNRNGVTVTSSSLVTIRRVNVNSTSAGIVLTGVTSSNVLDNVFPQNARGIQFSQSTSNALERNRITIAAGQYGLWFSDNMSLRNWIGTSNLVNEVPVQWYVDENAPRTVRGARVDLRGITNVAQMVVYRSSNLRIEDAFLTNGTNRGLFVVDSEDVTVTGTNASLNGGHGVNVVAGRRVRFLDGEASLNGGDGVRVELPGGYARNASVADQVGRVLAVGNKGRAVTFADAGHQGSVFDVEARDNGAGIVAVSVGKGFSATDNRVLRSGNTGINITFADSNASVTGNVVAGSRGDGIRVANSGADLNVRSNVVEENRDRGIFLHRVGKRAEVGENELRGNGKAGIALSSTWQASLVGNELTRHPRGIELVRSSGNSLFHNTIVKADNETGLFLADVYSYDNAVGRNTTVNGVPVQWHVGLRGTAAKPLVLADLRVEAPNVTNVAQIGLHNSSFVHLDRPVASNGSAVGLLLWQSHDVRVRGGAVRDNAGSGVLVHSNATAPGARASSNLFEDLVATGNGAAADDAGVKIRGAAAAGNVVRRALVTGNFPAGVRLEQAGPQNVLERSVVEGNAEAGVVLARATLATVQSNVLGNHTRVVDLAGSTSSVFQGNAMAIDPGSYGFFFRDEASYSNSILPNTTVNGVGVQWFTFVDGREDAPVVLRPAPVDVRGITNVAQVFVYRSSWIRVEGVVAENGTSRGVYVLTSSQVELPNATATNNGVGIELGRTLASRVLDPVATGNGVGVLLNGSSGNTVARAVTAGSKVSVRLAGSEENRVWGTDATDAGKLVLDDPSFVAGTPSTAKNLLVDAGLDQQVDADTVVAFSGAVVASPFRNEPVVRQRWDFGDGRVVEVAGANVSRPSHRFVAPGTYEVRLTVATPSATYDDTATVTVRDASEGEMRVRLACEPTEARATVGERLRFTCTATLVGGEPGPFAIPVVDDGAEIANVTVEVETDEPVPFGFDYVPNATGARLLRVGEGVVLDVHVADAPPENDAPAPGGVVALAAAALGLRRARARRP